MTTKIYTYECKCRRCGTIRDVFVSDKNQTDKNDWIRYKSEKSNYPTEVECKKCKKQTLHDVVAFGESEI